MNLTGSLGTPTTPTADKGADKAGDTRRLILDVIADAGGEMASTALTAATPELDIGERRRAIQALRNDRELFIAGAGRGTRLSLSPPTAGAKRARKAKAKPVVSKRTSKRRRKRTAPAHVVSPRAKRVSRAKPAATAIDTLAHLQAGADATQAALDAYVMTVADAAVVTPLIAARNGARDALANYQARARS